MDSAMMSWGMFQLGNLLFLSGAGVSDGSCHGVDGGWTLELSLWQCQGLYFLSELFEEHLLFMLRCCCTHAMMAFWSAGMSWSCFESSVIGLPSCSSIPVGTLMPWEAAAADGEQSAGDC